MGPEFEKGDGRLRPSLQQRLPGAERERGPRRDAQPLHATPLAAVLFPARGATSYKIQASLKALARQGAGRGADWHTERNPRDRFAPTAPAVSQRWRWDSTGTGARDPAGSLSRSSSSRHSPRLVAYAAPFAASPLLDKQRRRAPCRGTTPQPPAGRTGHEQRADARRARRAWLRMLPRR